MDERLRVFRNSIARLRPTLDREDPLWDELYIDPPAGKRSLATTLERWLPLAPDSNLLVIGGTGYGKTTQLHHAVDRIRNLAPDTHPVYVDIRQWQYTRRPLPGLLTAVASLTLAELANPSEAGEAKRQARQFAYEQIEWTPEPQSGGPTRMNPAIGAGLGSLVSEATFRIPGGLAAADFPAPRSYHPSPRFGEISQTLRQLQKAWDANQHLILLLDALDRETPERFQDAINQDLEVLRQAGIGVVIAGPYRLLHPHHASVQDRFDRVHRELALHPADPNHLQFFDTVLTKRVDASLLGQEQRKRLIEASGGILRDLLQMAKEALTYAFSDQQDQVQDKHVEQTINDFGAQLASTITTMGASWKHLLRQDSYRFNPSSPEDLELFEQGALVAYDGPQVIYRPHPLLIRVARKRQELPA